MQIALPRIWTQQPQFFTGIDWSNPITRGLVSWIVPTCIEPTITRIGTIEFGATTAGVALKSNGSGLLTKATPAFGSAATILSVGNLIAAAGGVGAPVGIGTSGAGNQLFIIQAADNLVTSARAVIRVANGGVSTTAESSSLSGNTSDAAMRVWAAVYDGTTALKLYRDGINNTASNILTGSSGAMSSMDNFSLGGANRGFGSSVVVVPEVGPVLKLVPSSDSCRNTTICLLPAGTLVVAASTSTATSRGLFVAVVYAEVAT